MFNSVRVAQRVDSILMFTLLLLRQHIYSFMDTLNSITSLSQCHSSSVKAPCSANALKLELN